MLSINFQFMISKFKLCFPLSTIAVEHPFCNYQTHTSAPPSRSPFLKHHVWDTSCRSQKLFFCHALMLSVAISLNATSTTCPTSRIVVGPFLFIRCCSCESICVNIGYSFITYNASHDSTGVGPKLFSGYKPSIHPDYAHPISWTSL
jgi:hypothetical protein